MSQHLSFLEFREKLLRDNTPISIDIETLNLPARLDVPMTIQIYDNHNLFPRMKYDPVMMLFYPEQVEHKVGDIVKDRPSYWDRTWMDVDRSTMPELKANFPTYIHTLEDEGEEEVHELRISKVDNGWIVKAGCMTFVFDDPNKLAVEITRYLNDPHAVIDEYLKKYNTPNAALGSGIDPGPTAGYAEADMASKAVDAVRPNPEFLRGGNATRRP